MSAIRLYGYIDNPVISSGFLIPIYMEENGGKFYFHELSADNRKIKGFKEVEINTLKNDAIVKVDPLGGLAEENGLSFFVVKIKKVVTWGSFDDIVNLLSSKIATNDLNSKTLIANARKLFGQYLKDDLVQEVSEVLSSLDGINKNVLLKELNKYKSDKLIRIIECKDDQFEVFFENHIERKNGRVFWMPDNATLDLHSPNVIVIKCNNIEFRSYFEGSLNTIQSSAQSLKSLKNLWKFQYQGNPEFENVYIQSSENIGQKLAIMAKKIYRVLGVGLHSPAPQSNQPISVRSFTSNISKRNIRSFK